MASSREVLFWNWDNHPTINIIEYITISTLGNSADFGDLTHLKWKCRISNSVRGIFDGGGTPAGNVDRLYNNCNSWKCTRFW